MENTDGAIALLRRLKALGVHIAIDDFGTGYSSLSYLLRLPADTLKIDRSFVSGSGDAGRNASIVRTVVGLADSLGLDVVAEGVETEEQRALLAGPRVSAGAGVPVLTGGGGRRSEGSRDGQGGDGAAPPGSYRPLNPTLSVTSTLVRMQRPHRGHDHVVARELDGEVDVAQEPHAHPDVVLPPVPVDGQGGIGHGRLEEVVDDRHAQDGADPVADRRLAHEEEAGQVDERAQLGVEALAHQLRDVLPDELRVEPPPRRSARRR